MALKKKRLKLKDVQTEAFALFEFLIAEAFARGKDMHYRLRVPYGAVKPEDGLSKNVEMVIDISVYFDGELQDARNKSSKPKRYTVLGPSKKRH